MHGITPHMTATLHVPGARARPGQKKSPLKAAPCTLARMMKLCIFAGTTIGGYLAAYAVSSYGMMAEVIASGVGSLVGVYLGWKLARRIDR